MLADRSPRSITQVSSAPSDQPAKPKRRFGPRSPTKKELVNVIGTEDEREETRLFKMREEEKRKNLEEELRQRPLAFPVISTVAICSEGNLERLNANEDKICTNVFERKRGGRQGGERCTNPATSSGLCRTCRNSSKFRPAPKKPVMKKAWIFDLIEDAIVKSEPDESGDFTWPVYCSDEKPNFTTYWAPISGNPREIEAVFAKALGEFSEDSLADIFIAVASNIIIRCGNNFWWFRTQTLKWTDVDPSVLLVQIGRTIAATAEIMLAKVPRPPKEPEEGQLQTPDIYKSQRASLKLCISFLRSTAKSKAVFKRVLDRLESVDDFESRKNMDMTYLPCMAGKVFNYMTGDILPRNFNHHFDYEATVDPDMATDEAREDVINYFRHLLWRDGAPATEEMVDSFLTILAIFISGDISDQSILFLKGEASNGKSQLISILEKMLGKAYFPASDAVFAQTEGQGASSALASVMGGKRLLGISEMNKAIRLSSHIIKRITSQDSISYREVYEKTRDGYMTGHFIIATNTVVQFDLIEIGLRRRIYCLEFPVRFVDMAGREWTDEDRASNVLPRRPEVIQRMQSPECKASLLLLLSARWRQWKATGSTVLPNFPGLENATAEFMADCAAERSNVSEFVSEKIVTREGSKLSTCEILESYKSWSSNPRTTASWLKERLFEVGIVSFKTGGKMYYKNVAFSTMSFPGVL